MMLGKQTEVIMIGCWNGQLCAVKGVMRNTPMCYVTLVATHLPCPLLHKGAQTTAAQHRACAVCNAQALHPYGQTSLQNARLKLRIQCALTA